MRIIDSLAKTKHSNARFSTFYSGLIQKPYPTINTFLTANTAAQKGIFELFFLHYNIGILVRPNGYDIYALDSDKIDEADKAADFLWESKNDVDYYWRRCWDKIPDKAYNTSDELRFEYFTVKAVADAMGLINSLK